ncbi:hypothetical protein CERSUDRAFT_103773 [Gelatoporia subvermispora B]|uniref:DUF6534 domain-containing protein n=1 Tax=Ceriporiopsis subvermispora (strain B) TaxID=914234 RepID=M2QRW9_CERS8|nr:hypothetical protein CERSUDRAFT_103773 [Gelatoporia subvermispora B]
MSVEYLRICTVTGHADPAVLEILPRLWVPEFLFSSLTFCIVQLFFIHKIWACRYSCIFPSDTLDNKKLAVLKNRKIQVPLTLVAVILSLVAFGAGGIGIVYMASLSPSIDWILAHVKIPASLQQIAAVVTDIYITVTLCILLRSSQSNFQNTQTLLSQLTVYVMNRGVLTVTIQLLHFVTYVATYNRSEFIWMVFHLPGSKVYVNSVLATLNIRHKLRDASRPNTRIQLNTLPEDSIGLVRPIVTSESAADIGV